ncbi:hypothetical protein EMIT0P265_150018 [Pseudomonas zeae]
MVIFDPAGETQISCRSEPARDGIGTFNMEVTDTPLSRAGSLLQGSRLGSRSVGFTWQDRLQQ